VGDFGSGEQHLGGVAGRGGRNPPSGLWMGQLLSCEREPFELIGELVGIDLFRDGSQQGRNGSGVGAVRQQLWGRNTKHLGKLDEVVDAKRTTAGLPVADRGLRAAKASGELTLRPASLLTNRPNTLTDLGDVLAQRTSGADSTEHIPLWYRSTPTRYAAGESGRGSVSHHQVLAQEGEAIVAIRITAVRLEGSEAHEHIVRLWWINPANSPDRGQLPR
jgi:hypothetical protein